MGGDGDYGRRMSPPRPAQNARRRRGEEGQALVEFALVLPVLCLLLFGIIQFGMLFYTYIDLTSATRDGAREVAVARSSGLDESGVKALVAASFTGDDAGITTVTAAPGSPWQTPGQDVTVRVTHPYKLDIMGLVLWDGPMTAESTSRIE